ncbi:hypothetical protein FOXYSP1_03408 [Fusarium oxysporum f. sp. phaseoli]
MPTITPGHRKKLTRASDAPFRGAGAPQWTLEASSKSPICNKHLSGPQRNDSVPMMTRGWLFLNSTLKRERMLNCSTSIRGIRLPFCQSESKLTNPLQRQRPNHPLATTNQDPYLLALLVSAPGLHCESRARASF